MSTKSLTAFVHIEKSAGTTLIHLLRKNFLLRYVDVRPVSRTGDEWFRSDDLKLYLKMNPMLECIGGHSVVPFSDLRSSFENLRYITVLREPVSRCISQYRQWTEKKGRNLAVQEFVNNPWIRNFQTKKICGDDDVEKAKRILREQFLAVGLTERFEFFLAVLGCKLSRRPWFYHEQKNRTGKASLSAELREEHFESFRSANESDLELYRYATEVLIPEQERYLENEFGFDLATPDFLLHRKETLKFHPYVDYVYRKLYLEPASNLLRRRGGMRGYGSYRSF